MANVADSKSLRFLSRACKGTSNRGPWELRTPGGFRVDMITSNGFRHDVTEPAQSSAELTSYAGSGQEAAMLVRPERRKSACPHDCPSACLLDVTVLPDNRIGRIAGSAENPYTAGVVCAKVARYAERVHHPDRLIHPLRRTGRKGAGSFAPISWDEALDEIAGRFEDAAQCYGRETV